MPKWYKAGKPTAWLRFRNRLGEVANVAAKRLGFPMVVEPTIYGERDAAEVERILKNGGAQQVFLSDEKYQMTDQISVEAFLALDDTDKERYVPIWHDCDDFSFRLMGQFHRGRWSCVGFAIAWSRVHAFNLFIDERGRVLVVEPQADRIFTLMDASEEYRPLELVIM